MSGILAQAATLLFANAGLQRPVGMEAQLSCFEVCGSNCFDLLQDGEKLVVRENANTKVEVCVGGDVGGRSRHVEIITIAHRIAVHRYNTHVSSRCLPSRWWWNRVTVC